MKKIVLTFSLFTFFHFCAQSQIGAPGLSIGTNEVLFEKGVIDIDLLAEIISEKQNELKQEFAKRTILNFNLSNGPYLTYNYANTVLTSLLDHKDKNVMKKQILESSTETAIVLAITEAFLKIKRDEIRELEKAYLLMMGDYTSMTFSTSKRNNRFKSMSKLPFNGKKYIGKKNLHDKFEAFFTNDSIPKSKRDVFPHEVISENDLEKDSNSKTKNKTKYYDSFFSGESKSNLGKGLPKVFHIYKMKDLGLYRGDSFYTYLNYLLLDMFLEICRENVGLQRLGFFQKNFDHTTFQQRSHYRRFLRERQDDKDEETKNFLKLLNDIYNDAGSIITNNLEFANVILNQPRQSFKEFISQAAIQAIDSTALAGWLGSDSITLDPINSLDLIITKATQTIFSKTLKLDLDSVSMTSDDEEALRALGDLAYYGINVLRSTPDNSKYDDWIQGINNIIPTLIRLNAKSDGELETVISNLEILVSSIVHYQKIIASDKISASNILTHMAEVFRVLTELNNAESYDQVAKWIVDLGNIFWDLPKNRLMSELSNLQAYLTVDSDQNKVDVKVEDLILYLGEKYIDDASGDVSLYFTLGFNNAYFNDNNPETQNNLNFASEKIGLKFKLLDIKQQRTYASRKYLVQQKPLVNDIYLLGYGSGLLYQIDALKTENDINGTTFGFLVGAHFFNGLDFGVGASSMQLQDQREWVFSTGFDIPITEYLGRLGKKRSEGN